MAGAIIAPSLPRIKEAFAHIPQAELLTQLVLTMPGIFIAGGAPVVGYIVDKFGRKQVLILSLVIYGLAGTAGFYISNIYLLLASRAVLGLAVAGIMTITNTLTADYFEGKERNQFVGLRGSFVAFGGVFFVSFAGVLAELSWREPFLIYLFSFAVLPLAIYFLYEPDIDREERESGIKPNLDYDKSWVRFVYIIAFMGMTLFYMVPVTIPFYLKEVIGVRDALVGISIGTAMMAGAIAALAYSTIKSYFNFNAMYSLCFLAMGTGFMIISQANTYPMVIMGLVINGLGIGMIGPNHALCLMNTAPAQLRGRILGTLTTFVFVGQFASPLVSKLAVDLSGSLSFSFALYGSILLLMAGGFVLGSLNFSRAKVES